MHQRVFAVLATCGTASCYYYQPLETPAPLPGSYLAATLTDTGADHLSRTIGPDVREVRGRLVTSDDQGLTVAVLGVRLHHGDNVTWKGEHVTLSREYLAGLEQRHLSRGRTLLIASALVLGAVTTYKVFQGLGSPPPAGNGPPTPR